jgi:hypothetical protein
MTLKPLNNRRSANPLIWNSPKIFKPRENLSWSIASTNPDIEDGNGTPYEYLRISFAAPDIITAGTDSAYNIVEYLTLIGLNGWRYGPVYDGADLDGENFGGTELPYPATASGSTWAAPGTSYRMWLLNKGSTPTSGTGPVNAPPPLAMPLEYQPDQQHFGFKRSNEPYGEKINHNYLYCEGSNMRSGERFALSLPKIHFDQTNREEVLSFYFHAMGSDIGKLEFFHAEETSGLYLDWEIDAAGSTGMVHSTMTATLGVGIAQELDATLNYFDADGTHINSYTSAQIDGPTHTLETDNWYRAELDLSELRDMDTHIIILYTQPDKTTTNYDYVGLSDFAITNILVSGNNYEWTDPAAPLA